MSVYRRAVARPPKEETPEEWLARSLCETRERITGNLAGAVLAAVSITLGFLFFQ
jgi:hypothetical protein